ncbi:unnamed protein product [Auanema sp. JU1783]|nr:unnamed protein product [Auanema sp. JU1783]
MTFRGCYTKFYNMMDPNTIRPPNHSYCTVGEVPLTCLSDASIIEYSCWCDGDHCNSSPSYTFLLVLGLSMYFLS